MTHLLPKRARDVFARIFNPYRPELHYMRGPGPKWREKNLSSTGHPPATARRMG